MCGIHDGRLQRRLLAESYLTFCKAFELCQASELAEKNAQKLQAGQKQSQKVAGASIHLALHSGTGGNKYTSPPSCYQCDSTQHLFKDCRFKPADCHICGKRVHIAKACHSKEQPHSTQQGRGKQSQRSSQHTHPKDSNTGGGSYSLFTLSAARAAPITVTVTVNGADRFMEVDTGASLSIMTKSTFTTT